MKENRVPRKPKWYSMCGATEIDHNVCFSSVFTSEKGMEVRLGNLGKLNANVLRRVLCMFEEVLNVVKYMKVDKSLGPYEIYPSILWEARVIMDISELYQSWANVPQDRRLAYVVHLFTNVCKEKHANYRSVNVTTV